MSSKAQSSLSALPPSFKLSSSSSSSSSSFFGGTVDGGTMDGLYHVLEYLRPTELYALGVTNKFLTEFIFHQDTTEQIFQQLLLVRTRQYQQQHSIRAVSGRIYFQNCFYLKRSIMDLKNKPQYNNKETEQQKKKRHRCVQKNDDYHQQHCTSKMMNTTINRVGLFTNQQEDSILMDRTSNGYFGLEFIRRRRCESRDSSSNNVGHDSDRGVIAIWGDFSGIYLTTNFHHILNNPPSLLIPVPIPVPVSVPIPLPIPILPIPVPPLQIPTTQSQLDFTNKASISSLSLSSTLAVTTSTTTGTGTSQNNTMTTTTNNNSFPPSTTVDDCKAPTAINHQSKNKNTNNAHHSEHDTSNNSGYLFGRSYQVMSILFGEQVNGKSNVFIGFASGTIYCIDSNPVKKDEKVEEDREISNNNKNNENDEADVVQQQQQQQQQSNSVEYPQLSECSVHCPNEISSLCSIEGKHIASSSVQGSIGTTTLGGGMAHQQDIIIHWNALLDGNLQRISKVSINPSLELLDNINNNNNGFQLGVHTMMVPSPLAMSSSTFCCNWNSDYSSPEIAASSSLSSSSSSASWSTNRSMTFLSIGASNQTLTTVWWDTGTVDNIINQKYNCNTKTSNYNNSNNNNSNVNNTTNSFETSNSMNKIQSYLNVQVSSYDKSSFGLASDGTHRSLPLPKLVALSEYFHKRSRQRSTRTTHHFVFVQYYDTTKLIIGTSKGDLLRIDMNPQPPQAVSYSSNVNSSTASSRYDIDVDDDEVYISTGHQHQQPSDIVNPSMLEEELERCDILYNCCRGGMVESVEVVGGGTTSKKNSSSSSSSNMIMITAGGMDGKIRFWDWKTFANLGQLVIHPGKWIPSPSSVLALGNPHQYEQTASTATAATNRDTDSDPKIQQVSKKLYYSPVVFITFCHERSSLISLCRDGHVYEWNIKEGYNQSKDDHTITKQSDNDDENQTTSIDGCSSTDTMTMPRRRSVRRRRSYDRSSFPK